MNKPEAVYLAIGFLMCIIAAITFPAFALTYSQVIGVSSHHFKDELYLVYAHKNANDKVFCISYPGYGE